MAVSSQIEWTEATWNPITGCTPISSGCKNCYALRMSNRLKAMGNPNYSNGFALTLHEHMLERPLKWKRPRRIFVNSMSDIFHEDVPLPFIQQIFQVMKKANWHTFQILTKRAERLAALAAELSWTQNIWLGVTVESQEYLHRIDYIRSINAGVRFLSLEPLLTSMPKIDLTKIDWVIVGGESGPHARPMNKDWVENIKTQCSQAQVPFFFKQWGGTCKKRSGRLLQGKLFSEFPAPKSFFSDD